ncbi:MAG: cyclodeaminase/cyclohydrolase family protein [Povalibacter sp.]
MRHIENLADRSLGAVIEAIASDDVSPGAGSAAAVGLALAAACAGKAVAITRKHRSEDARLIRAQQELADILHRALHGADEDAAHFREFVHEKDAGSLQNLLRTGEELQQLGSALHSVLEGLEGHIDSAVEGDIKAARVLCAAFSVIQSENLAENRGSTEQIGRS